MKKVSKTVLVADLKRHPFHAKIYEVNNIDKLAKSIDKLGQINRVIIDKKGYVLQGWRMVEAILLLSWLEILVYEIDVLTDEEAIALMLGSNCQRSKTTREILNEARYMVEQAPSRQGQRTDLEGSSPDGAPKEKGDRFNAIARAVTGGTMSASSIRRLLAIENFENTNPGADLRLLDKIDSKEISIFEGYQATQKYGDAKKEEESIKPISIFNSSGSDENYTIYNKSCEDMSEIGHGSIPLIITSIPYFDARTYGNDNKPEIGRKRKYEQYIESLDKAFAEIYRVLSTTGSFYLNVGDTYDKGTNNLVSSRLLIRLCDRFGFFCANEVIWKKKGALPQTTEKRLQPTYEKFFHLVKSPDYFYEPYKFFGADKKISLGRVLKRNKNGGFDKANLSFSKTYQKLKDFIDEQEFFDIIYGRNAGSDSARLHKLVPTVDHPAIFPTILPVLPILTSSKFGDTVLDPFGGSGTVGEVALMLGRKFIMYELEERFCRLTETRLQVAKKTINKDDMEKLQALFGKNIDIGHFAQRDEADNEAA